MLLIFLNGLRHFVDGDRLNGVPVLEQIEDLIDSRPEVGIGSEQVPHHVLHFLAHLATAVLYVGVDYAELALLLERVKAIVEHEQDAAEHPDVHPIIDGVLEVEVDHLGRAIHEGGVLLKPLFVMVYFGLRQSLQLDLLCAAAAQIAQLCLSLCRNEDVLYFQVLVDDAQIVHLLHPLHGLPENFNDLGLRQHAVGLLRSCQQIVNCFTRQFHQDVGLEVSVPQDFMEPVVADNVLAGGESFHHFDLVVEVVLLLVCLADQLLQCVLLLGVDVLNEKHIAVSSLCDLMQLSQLLA